VRDILAKQIRHCTTPAVFINVAKFYFFILTRIASG